MASSGASLRRPVHGRARHRDRERRTSLDSDRSRLLPAEPPVGPQRLRARLRRVPAARWTHRRPARPAADLRRGDDSLHVRLAPLRPRVERRIADRRPRDPGSRRRVHHPRSARDPRDHVHRRPRAEHRSRRVGRGRRLRRRGRRALRRHPHRPALVGVDLLRQHPGRPRRPGADAAPPLREPGPARPELRRAGRGARHVGPVDARPRDHPGPRLGLGLRRDDRRLRGVGRAARVVRRLGVARQGPAHAVLDLPAADADRVERRRVRARARRCSRCS